MNVLLKTLISVLALSYFAGCAVYEEQPYYNPQPPIHFKNDVKIEKNGVLYKSSAEGYTWEVVDDAESVARAGKMLGNEKYAGKQTRVANNNTDGNEYNEYGYKQGTMVGFQVNNLSSYDIMTIWITRSNGEKLDPIVGLPRGKISRPIPLRIGEKIHIKTHYIISETRGSKKVNHTIEVKAPIVKIGDEHF